MNSIFDPQDTELTDQYRLRQLLPHEQIALRGRKAELGMDQGAEGMLRGALKLPESQGQSRGQAGLELRELAKKVAPGTVEFYTAAVDILRKHGLVGEADQMAKKLHDLEIGKGETTPALKLQRARDELVKRLNTGDESVKPAIAAIDKQIAALGTVRVGSTPADPEFVKLLNQYEAALEVGQGDRATVIKQYMDAFVKQKQGSGADMTPYQSAMLKIAQDREKREAGKVEDKKKEGEAAAVRSLQGLVRALDNDIQAAQRLLVHPGLSAIIGPQNGAVPGPALVAIKGANAGGAHAVFLTVEAQAFIQALQDLKLTSKTGASGLGQLTEREGDKIQAAKAPLNRQQGDDQFKRSLQDYIAALQSTRATAAQEITGAKAEVPAPRPVVDDSAKPRDAATVAPGAFPQPAPAPAAQPKPKYKAERVG